MKSEEVNNMDILLSFKISFKQYRRTLILLALMSLLPNLVMAIPITASASGNFDATHGSVTSYMPLGTTIYSDITFDVGPTGNYDDAIISNSSGSLWWTDQTNGLQTFSLDSMLWNYAFSPGILGFGFDATGPAINDKSITRFEIYFDIGENPFTSTNNLVDQLASADVYRMGFGVREDGNGIGEGYTDGVISEQVSMSTVNPPSSVPEPPPVFLLALGLAGLGFARKQKKS